MGGKSILFVTFLKTQSYIYCWSKWYKVSAGNSFVGVWYGRSGQKVKDGSGVIPEIKIMFCGLSLKMCSPSFAS